MENEFIPVQSDVLCSLLQSQLFHQEYKGKFYFILSVLLGWANQAGIKNTVEDIADWERFETGKIDFGAEDFFALFLKQEQSSEPVFFIVSDEFIADGLAYSVKTADFSSFVAFYEDSLRQEFFQPSDYILFFPSTGKLKIIHHEGKLITLFA